MTKGYTINLFINLIKTLKESDLKKKEIYTLISPRGGWMSTKCEVFDGYLTEGWNITTTEIIEGKTARAKKLGKTAKTRLITALKNRKTKKKIF